LVNIDGSANRIAEMGHGRKIRHCYGCQQDCGTIEEEYTVKKIAAPKTAKGSKERRPATFGKVPYVQLARTFAAQTLIQHTRPLVKRLYRHSQSKLRILILRRYTYMWLFERPIAHRGLHNETLTENSMGAFRNALEHGYNIEIDVHLLKSGEVVIFHDGSLNRVCGKDVKITDLTLDDIKGDEYLLPSGEHIPLLTELLDLIATEDGNTSRDQICGLQLCA
jgi:hypothetical protein